MRSSLALLASFVPRALRETLARGEVPERIAVDGVALVADISGYTSLTEALAAKGEAGPEELSAVLNASFSRLVDLVYLYGGDVLSFAGDALMAVWSAPGGDARRGALLAAALARAIHEQGPVSAGEEAPVRLRVGLARGTVEILPLEGAGGRWTTLVGGPAVSAANEALRRVSPGQVGATAALWSLLEGEAEGSPLADGMISLNALRRPTPTAPLPPPPLDGRREERFRDFLPAAVSSRLGAGQSAWLAELRTVTALFVNLTGLRGDRLPPQAELAALVRALGEPLARFEGALDRFTVDEKGVSALCAFGLPPLSHEDDASRGVRASLAILDALTNLGLTPAIGVATGRVFCGTVGSEARREYTVLGGTINLAARLMQAAVPGEVLTDEPTRLAASDRVRFGAPRAVFAKGLRAPVAASVAEGLATATLPGLGPAGSRLYGRDADRAWLSREIEQHRASPQGGLLWIEAQAGLGKSRLLREAEALARDAGLRVLSTSADPIERLTPYHAWRPVFSTLLALGTRSDRSDIRAALAAALDPSQAALAPLLNGVLGLGLDESEETARLGPQARAERTRDLLLGLLERWSERETPAVLVLDDAQWLDSASWTLLEAVSTGLGRFCVVLAARPAEGPEAPEATWLRAAPQTRTRALMPLSPLDSSALVREIVGTAPVPETVANLLISRAQGNPFYLGELARALRDGNARVDVTGSWSTLEPASLPLSVEAAIRARIDRLPPEAQLTLKVGSVIGRSFSLEDLAAIHPLQPSPEAVLAPLDALERVELLVASQKDHPKTWLFPQSLVRDTAYGLMTFGQRHGLHRALATRMDAAAAAGETVDLPVLAFHWTRAEVADKAVDALDRAGEEASRQFALSEMNRFFRKALELAPEAPPARRFRWNLRLGVSRLRVGLPGEARTWLNTALELRSARPPATRGALLRGLLQQLGVRVLRRFGLAKASETGATDTARVWLELSWVEYFLLEPLHSVYAMLRAVNAAEGGGPSYELGVGYASLSAYATFAGLDRVAAGYRARSLEVLEQTADPATGGPALAVLGAAALARARWEDAADLLTRGRALHERAGLYEDRDLAGLLLGMGELSRGRPDEARLAAEAARATGDRRGSLIVRVRSRFLSGVAALVLGEGEGAVRRLREASALAETGGPAMDVASRLCGQVGNALAALLSGERAAAAAQTGQLLADPKVAAALISPAFPLSRALGMLLCGLAAADPAWRAPSAAWAKRLRGRSRTIRMHAPFAALWAGMNAQNTGDAARAIRIWRRGLAEAAVLGMAGDEALLRAALGEGEGGLVLGVMRRER